MKVEILMCKRQNKFLKQTMMDSIIKVVPKSCLDECTSILPKEKDVEIGTVPKLN